jgi:hypothetical protein
MNKLYAAVAIVLVAASVTPMAHAAPKFRFTIPASPAPLATPVPKATPAPYTSPSPQAGGLPATNERVTALEAAVVALRSDLTAEIAARKAADAALTTALNEEVAARKAADAALASQIATIPSVYVSEGAANNIRAATVTVASKTVPAGTYFLVAAVQMINSQTTGDANARCVMRADGNILADTSDVEFPILTSEASVTNQALGSTLFAPLQGSYSSTSAINVIVECSESNGDNGGLDAFVHLAALKAGTVQ